MHLAADAEEPAEAHDEWTPLSSIDVGTRFITDQKGFLDMQFHNVHFKRIRGNILAEWTNVMNRAFHLHRTLRDARRCNGERRQRRKAGNAELVGFIAVSPAQFLFRDRILTGSQR